MNDNQKVTFHSIIDCYASNTRGLFFVYGSGRTVKIYLWRTVIAKIRPDRKIVLSVASSGIAALLLQRGRITHSKFKIQIKLDEFSSCSINHNSNLAKLI